VILRSSIMSETLLGFSAAIRARLSRHGHLANPETGWFDRAAARLRLPFDRLYLERSSNQAGLAALADSVSNRHSKSAFARARPKIAVCALRGIQDHNAYEVVIAQALRLRGADVTLITCGGGLPACEVGWPREAFPRPCDRCAWLTEQLACASGLKHERIGDHLPWGNDPRAAPRIPDSPPTGFDQRDAALASSIWRLRTADIGGHRLGPSVLRENEIAAAGAYRAAEAIFDQCKPDAVLMLNGLFAAERGIRAAALSRGIRVPTYEIAPRDGALVFSQNGFAPHFDMAQIWESYRDIPLFPDQAEAIDVLMADRRAGVGAHESYGFGSPNNQSIRSSLGIPAGSRLITLFANIPWDTAFAGSNSTYDSMIDFIVDAVERMSGLPDCSLVIRSHPAEVKWGTDQPIEPTLRTLLGRIPKNVRFVSANNDLNSYQLASASDLILAYATTLGLEAAFLGLPVVVASDVHYRDRGFTIDLNHPDELDELLRGPTVALSIEQKEIARRYAFAFFFRLMISFPEVQRSNTGQVARVPLKAQAIEPGSEAFIDFICEALITGQEFDLPEELTRDPFLSPTAN